LGSEYHSMSDQSEIGHSSNGSDHFLEKDLDIEIIEESVSSNSESGRYESNFERNERKFRQSSKDLKLITRVSLSQETLKMKYSATKNHFPIQTLTNKAKLVVSVY
jgi:hypothetical protein